MNKDCVSIACDNTCPNGSSSTSTSSASSSRKSTIAGSDSVAPVEHNSSSFKRKCIAFLPLLFSQNSQQLISANSLGIVTAKELEELSRRMTSRGFDRSVRQTIPTTRRKARTSPRSSSVSSDMRASSRLETQDLIEAEREYQRQQDLEKSATDLAMEAMEYKFMSRRKRLMAKKLARETKDKSDDDRQQTRFDSNGNLVNVSRSGTQSVAPDLSLSITTKMDFCDPEVLLEKPEARRELTPDESVRAKHDREMKKYDESESNGKKRSRFTASLIRTHTSDSDQEPEDSGYEAKSCLTDATQMDPSRAVSRGSFSSSLRPFSSEFEESAWGSQELLESDSSVRKKSTKSRSSDDLELEHDMFQDAEECIESLIKYGDFEAGGIETPAEYEVIDLPPTRIDVKDKADKSDKNNYTKDLSTPLLMKTRRPRVEGRRSTSDPVRDRISSPALHLPSVVRRGSTAMPYHFAMPSSALVGYMRPTVASLKQRYEREDIDANNILQTSARDRFKISDEENYRIKKAEEEIKTKKLDEERNKRYEEWLKKLDEVNIIPQSAKERVKKLENEIYRIKKPDESESPIARAYRRIIDDDNELIFPISRKTQTKPDLLYQVKMISRSTQTDEVSTNDVSVNTEIDFRLMSALLDKLLIAKTSVAVQTDWKNDVVETRDVGVSTERIFRERLSPLPSFRSMSAQTDVSTLKSKDKSVATDPEITGHRHRNRSSRDPLSTRLSSGVQTDQKWISRKDVSCEANFSSFSSESEESVVYAYPKGFHPKTGQLLDEKLLSNYYKINDQNSSKYGLKSRDNNLHKLSKTPEPIIEEYGSSTSSESYSEGDYNCENVREIYREKYAEFKSSKPIPKTYYMRSEEKRVHLDLNERKRFKDRNLLETDLEQFDREPHKQEFRAKFMADKVMPETRQTLSINSPQITTKPLPMMKTSETQTNDVLTVAPQSVMRPQIKFIPKDLKTESKIMIEVTKARKKERSEVTSLTKLNDDGKMSRTTRVTTSKHIPVLSDRDIMRKITEDKKSPITPPKRPLSPMRKAQSEINVMPVNDVSTRPASAVDLSMMQTQTGPKIPSTISLSSSSKSPNSSLKSPSPALTRYTDEISVPKVGRVSIQDPLHLVLIAPPESFNNKDCGNTLLMPINKSQWKETSSSTICNEMSTDAFKDDEGNALKPKSISMTTETLIENKGSESKVQTRSRTARKYSPEVEEKAITTESTAVTGSEDPYVERERTAQPFSPPQTSASPLVTLVDTPDIPDFISPEPEQLPESIKLSNRKRSIGSEMPSLARDVRSSRYRPDEEECNKLVNASQRRAAIVEPVQQMKTAIASDVNKNMSKSSGSSPATEIITRIIRTSEPDESKKSRKSKTVLEQELQSGDMSVGGGGGCRISSSITFDNPSTPNRGVIIKELNEDGTSKDGSMDDLDQKSGEIMTETNFQRFKTPRRGSNGCEETSWKYSMECNCVNGSNTTVRSSLVVFSSSAAQLSTTRRSHIH